MYDGVAEAPLFTPYPDITPPPELQALSGEHGNPEELFSAPPTVRSEFRTRSSRLHGRKHETAGALPVLSVFLSLYLLIHIVAVARSIHKSAFYVTPGEEAAVLNIAIGLRGNNARENLHGDDPGSRQQREEAGLPPSYEDVVLEARRQETAQGNLPPAGDGPLGAIQLPARTPTPPQQQGTSGGVAHDADDPPPPYVS